MNFDEKDVDAMNALRFLSVDMIEKANSGHPGLPIDAAPMVYTLWEKVMNFNPNDPQWPNRDRFILSAGHGSSLLYSLLHLNGFDLEIDDLRQFRQVGSKTPGHPEIGITPGIDATTGPLGQGLGMAVGMAMAEKHLAAELNRPGFDVINHFTYTLVGDGDLMEGISHEAANIAANKGLNKLVVLYDSNDISLDGLMTLSSNDDIKKRFEASGWDYQKVIDGNDMESIFNALVKAKQEDKPSIIEIKTMIGYGTPNQGTNKVHGSALGESNLKKMRQFYNWQFDNFEISDEIYTIYQDAVQKKQWQYNKWKTMFAEYRKKFGDVYDNYSNRQLNVANVKVDWGKYKDPVATRTSSSDFMQQIADQNPHFWGGSADLSSSNKTKINESSAFTKLNGQGRNVYFGVREFGMAAAVNGINLYGGSRAFASTFLVFSDYLKAAIRLAAIQKSPSIFVFTHDSLAVGEDGPTHEPVEQLAALRTIPEVNVFRPVDAKEVLGAWQKIGEIIDQPSILVLTRQKTPLLNGSSVSNVAKGAYVVSPAQNSQPDGILMATGSEVALAVEAQQRLKEASYDVSVVSMPSMELFRQQTETCQNQVLPKEVTLRISIEMGSTFGWKEFTGTDGVEIGVNEFGISGKDPEVVEKYGFTVDHIIEVFNKLWSKYDESEMN